MTNEIISILNITGVIVFAVSGALKGMKYNLDILGVTILGITTALGGGILRDIIMNTIPVSIVKENDMYFAIVTSIVTYFFINKIVNYVTIIKIFDAAGLAVFTIIGAEKGMLGNLGLLGIIITGTLTGVAGGVIRDILVNEIPFILKEEVYAMFCIFGSFLYWFFVSVMHFNKNIVINILIIFIFIGRLLAIKFDWHLPRGK